MGQACIEYAIVDGPLGFLLVAATERGVCNVRFGHTAAELEAGLRAEFPFAAVEANPERLRRWVAALVRYLEGGSQQLDVPLDVRGSQFQRRVWNAICAIPYGRTRSYGDIAEALGRPGAARAVARACAANPLAVAIPCHRVVGRRGELRGYRWGVDRKRALLAREAAVAKADRVGGAVAAR
ncbi:MAG: methylated-DNA--[protein]-cysteine S-methyltransferase [Myxococcota bacterium]